ncbi:S8 family serine peptidase [Paracoccus sp. Z118]|uniref:S8 family serine peptidase n=1 Tax=Paracoccus sp. Z118 TaxID=2851017 RepID=UPI001C2C6143|nr:S8 family serine peptidase [Paracoccus sp. Z118]MBV0890880.1 S8 family serine peptidase [Paracoccus sp. Z118]
MRKVLLILLAASMSLTLQPRIDAEGVWLLASAFADEDDDDDDGGDDDDDDDDDDGPRVRAAPARPIPLPQRAGNEILVRGLSDQELAELSQQDFTVLERSVLASGETLARLRKPAVLTMDEALSAARQSAPAGRSDFNHFYRSEQAANCEGIDCPARQMIDWPVSAATCGPLPRMGMVDTGVNTRHEALAGASIDLHRMEDERAPSDLLHGTAVASLLVGDPESRAPGLVPQAELVAVDAFHRAGQDQRTDAFALVRALDHLRDRQARIVNLSLAGPPNDALEAQIAEMERQGLVLIAAAGNMGPSAPPAYPAAYPQVIAVTGVDRRGAVYRRANRGPHIDIAAPGVDVWTAASVSGARTKTGTSYAAPFVSAAAALLLQAQPSLTAAEVRARLLERTRDLGAEGRDNIFGHGLLTPPAGCS